MNKRWLILDCNFLCHRLKHAMGGLSHDNSPTGVIYGFLKSIPMYQEKFDTPHIVFCWDSKTSKRKEIFPGYKSNRVDRLNKMSDEEIIFEDEFRYQMKMLRKKYLRMIGFRNVFCQKGYEADDLIASVCNNLSKSAELTYGTLQAEAIILTSDHDLYQCLSPQVSIYDPNKRKRMTYQKFKKKYEIEPDRWATMKAIAGCSSDNIPGLKGVGEKTAILFLTDKLKKTTKSFERIKKFCWKKKSRERFLLYLTLTHLPLNFDKVFKLKKDELSADGWQAAVRSLGLKSIKDRVPMGIRRKKKKK